MPSHIKKLEAILDQAKGERERLTTLLGEELHKKRLALFLGAGCSVAAGLPSWNDLIFNLLEKYEIRTRERDLLRIATRLEKQLGTGKLRELVVEALSSITQSGTALYEAFAHLDVNLYITTNYDHLFEDVLVKRGIPAKKIYRDQDLPSIDLTQKVIVKLHGDLDSPSSLILTSGDYARFSIEHKGIKDWLNSAVSQYTILFIGTSFEDPRLKDADTYALTLFGQFRRQPFILMRVPHRSKSQTEEDYETALDDFVALCDDFRLRGFHTLLVEKYEHIPPLIQKIHDCALELRLKSEPQLFRSTRILEEDYVRSLEKKLGILLDEKIVNLSESIRGKGRLPVFPVMLSRVEELIAYMDNPPHLLSPESQLEAYISIADGLLMSTKGEDLSRAREYFDKANSIFQTLQQKSNWEQRLLRVRAKLFFFEGKIDDALSVLSDTKDDKSASIWLAILIDSGRFAEAYAFVSSAEPKPEWVCEALHVLVHEGESDKASRVFSTTFMDFEKAERQGKLKESAYKSSFFFEKLCHAMAAAYYLQAIRLAGKKAPDWILPQDLTEIGKELCNKALAAVDLLFSKVARQDLSESYFVFRTMLIEMNAAFLLGLWERADDVAQMLMDSHPIEREVAEYIIARGERSQTLLENLNATLIKDHPMESWAWLARAALEAGLLHPNEDAWNALNRAIELAATERDKQDLALKAPLIGRGIDRFREVILLVREVLSPDDPFRKLIDADYERLLGNHAKAKSLYTEIETSEVSTIILSEVKCRLADYSLEEKKDDEGRRLLEEATSLNFNAFALEKLLALVIRQQDFGRALAIAERLELSGLADWRVIQVKAQAARNLRQYQKSEEAWHRLLKEFPEKPEFLYGLADVLAAQDKIPDALEVLKRTVEEKGQVDLKCLILACDLYMAMENYSAAFGLLDARKETFTDEPALLFRHFDLGFRTGHELEAHESLQRMEELRQQGKIPESAFRRVSLDEVEELIKKQAESRDKLRKSYVAGQIPRLMVCDHTNIPPYLDWAIRVQKAVLPGSPQDRIDLTIYSTNGLYVKFGQKKAGQIVPITAPASAKEIVIDYTALITLHRLGMLELLTKQYEKVFYPEVLKTIWLQDQERFHYPQYSRQRAFKALLQRVNNNEIKEKTSPLPTSEYRLSNRDLSAAALENMPLISSFIKASEAERFPKAIVIRCTQLIDWLYQKGKLSESTWKRIRRIPSEEPEICSDPRQILDKVPGIILDQMAAEYLEENGLIQEAISVGFQVFLETFTAAVIRNTVFNIEFTQSVGQWHKELAETVRSLRGFRPIDYPVGEVRTGLKENDYFKAFAVPILYATHNDLCLLTDDRWTQMAPRPNTKQMQFGTDVLLYELFKKRIINAEEYARAFHQLCEWRYRFLVPGVQVLLELATQYKNNLPGASLADIAKYGRASMEDAGLFLGFEPTDPPMALGFKYYMEWLDCWLKLLAELWQDKNWETKKLEKFTDWFYQYAFPEVPMGFEPSVRVNLEKNVERVVVMKLLLSASQSPNSKRLYTLLQRTFDRFLVSENSRIEDLKNILQSIEDLAIPSQKPITADEVQAAKRGMAARVLTAFEGKDLKEIRLRYEIIPILQRLGFPIRHDIIGDAELEEYIPSLLDDTIPAPVNVEFIRHGPILAVAKDEKRLGFVLHNLIRHHLRETRLQACERILSSPYSFTTKEVIKICLPDLSSVDELRWQSAAEKCSDAVLHDFKYALELFSASITFPIENKQLTEVAWKAALNPRPDTLATLTPISLKDMIKNIEAVLYKKVSSTNTAHNILDSYLNDVFYMPVDTATDAYDLIVNAPGVEKARSVDILNIASDWLKNNENDPLAYLIALDVILRARASSVREEQKWFIGGDFYRQLDGILRVLFVEESNDTNNQGSSAINRLHCIWNIRQDLAKYYLMYLDLNSAIQIDESGKVALAWWMARELESAILKIYKNWIGSEEVAHLRRTHANIILSEVNSIWLIHRFVYNVKDASIGRCYTLEGGAPLICATLSLIMPGEKHPAPFDGLKIPTDAFPPELVDTVIGVLASRTLLGEGQLPRKSGQDQIPLLWDTPICVSAPAFLRKYYGDSFDLLGTEKTQVIQMAEKVSEDGFLKEALKELPGALGKKEGSVVTLTLICLMVFVMTQKKVPSTESGLWLAENIVARVERLDSPWNSMCLSALLSIVFSMQRAGLSEHLTDLSRQFIDTDLEKHSDDYANLIIQQVLSIAMLGRKLALFDSLVARRHSDKRVRTILGRTKQALEKSFSKVPAGFRSNVREILNKLEDVPVITNE